MFATRTILTAIHTPESGTDTTDAELLRRFAECGDEMAFEAIVRRHARLVWGVCRRTLHSVQDAEDAFQSAFLVLARNPEKPRRSGTAAGFLFGVARRVALKSCAQSAARAARSIAPPPEGNHDPATEVALRELQSIINEEIARLPEVYRLPFVLCVLEDVPRARASVELGVNSGTLSARLARARLLLRTRLAKRGVQLTSALALTDLTSSVLAVPSNLVRATVATSMSGRSVGIVGTLVSLLRARLILGGVVGLVACAAMAAGLVIPGPTPNNDLPNTSQEKTEAKPQVVADANGDPLPTGAVARLGSTRWRHEGEVQSMSFSPDGKTLAVLSGNESAVTYFDTTTGKVLHRLTSTDGSPGSRVVAVALTNTRWATRQDDQTIRIWDSRTTKLIHTFKLFAQKERLGEGGAIWFSADGKFLAARGSDHLITVWDVASGTQVTHVRWEKLDNPNATFSPDGKLLAIAAIDPVVQLFDVATGKYVRGFDPDQQFALCLAFSPDGKVIATGGKDRIILSDSTTGKEVGRMTMKQVLGVAFTPDGKSLVSFGEDAKVRIWDVTTKKERQTLDSHGWIGRSMALSADGKMVAAGTVYNVVRVWDVATGKELSNQVSGHDAAIRTVAYSPDGKTLVTGGPNQHIHLWDAATFRPIGQIKGASASQVAFSPDSKQLASTWEWNTRSRVWDIERRVVLHELAHDAAKEVPSIAFTPDGKQVLTMSWWWNGQKPMPNTPRTTAVLRSWDVATGKTIRDMTLPGVAHTVLGISPDGRFAAVGGWGESPLWLCDLKRGHERRLSQEAWNTVKALAFSPDGRILATGGVDRENVLTNGDVHRRVRLWEISTGREIMKLSGHERAVTAMAFSPSGRILATADGGDNFSSPAPPPGQRSIRFWDVASGKELARLGGHGSDVTSLAFSPDGMHVVVGLSVGTALVWETPTVAKVVAKPGRKLGPKELAALWSDLAGDDAAVAYEAVRILAASPEQSLPFLANKLHPAAKLDATKLQKQIADLGSETFAVRESASQELSRLGEDIEAELQRALKNNPSAEAITRLQRLLTALRNSPPANQRQELRAMWVLERVGTPAAEKILSHLAKGDPHSRPTREAKAALGRR